MMEEVYSAIDTAIMQNRSFAVYRIPGENKLRFVAAEENAVEAFYDIRDLNGQQGYIISPFHISQECPIICLHAEEKIWELSAEMFNDNEEWIQPEMPRISPRFRKRFYKFLAPLQDQYLDKVVLTRHSKIERPENFSPTQAFWKACQRYPRSYVYLYHTPITGTWLGSTPEILLSGEGNRWHTIALAGTQSVINGLLPSIWSVKNLDEQAMVADYLRDQLTFFGLEPEENGPYAMQAGKLAHLRSDFRFTLPDNDYLGDLLKILHPTPAVCGLPKEEAFRYIIENEGYDRFYYSGFLGWLEPQGKSDIYVNLRCMRIGWETLILYAGSGMLSTSTIDEEWKETEEKMWTMKTLI